MGEYSTVIEAFELDGSLAGLGALLMLALFHVFFLAAAVITGIPAVILSIVACRRRARRALLWLTVSAGIIVICVLYAVLIISQSAS